MSNNLPAKTGNNDFQLIPLNDFDRKKYNSLMPMSVGEMSELHSVRYFSVELSPDPRDGDVYPESGNLALRKRALEQLADAAGVIWDVRNCHRIDDLKDDDLVIFQVVGGIRRPDGTIKAITGTKEINLRDLQKNSDADKANGGKGMSTSELSGIRKHKTRLAETKAYLAALRSLLKIKSTYTAEELRRPFVVAQVYLDPAKDPEVARVLRQRALEAMQDCFGQDVLAEQKQPPALNAAPTVVEDEEDDAPYDDDAPDEPSDMFATPTSGPADDEAAYIRDMRTSCERLWAASGRQVAAFAKWADATIRDTPYADASLDQLTALRDAVAALPKIAGQVRR